ncbi:MAG: hypothetical protein ACOYBX_11295 [Mycobacterium sp.]|jgi:hypothetical protein
MTVIPPAPRPAWDRALAVLMTALTAVAALGSVGSSLFFVMGTDACGPNNCHESRLWLAYALTWGGVAVAVIGTIAGLTVAARRGTVLWIWPALAVVLIGASWAGGAALATSVAR